MIKDVFLFADGDTSQEISVGNKMRRVLEAFSTFCYRKGIAEVSCDDAILSQLGEYADYFENRMYRLLLHGESHFEEQVYSFHDAVNFYEYFSVEEKIKTVRDVLCFMYLLNSQHVKSYLPEAEQKLIKWCDDIQDNMHVLEQNDGQHEELENIIVLKKVKLYDLPISAGYGIDIFDETIAGEDYDTWIEECDFALRIRGDSMEPMIENGGIVLIHKQETLEHGEIGAFYYNGHTYCKKYSCIGGKIQLISINPLYSPIIVEENDRVKCYGKVIYIVPKK